MIEKVSNDIAYSEVYEILNLLGKDFIDKIPKKLYKEFEEYRKKNYSSNFIRKDKTIDESKISKKAVAMFTYLNLKYFIEDESEKERIKDMLKKNG